MYGIHRQATSGRPATFFGIALLAALWGVMAEAAPPKISQAVWSDKTATLAVKGAATGAVEVFDLNGRRLGAGTGAFSLSLARADLLDIPCAVRVADSAGEAVKAVSGAPKLCAKAPNCTIVSPKDGAKLAVGRSVRFEAKAASTDKSAQPIKYAWDFAGGAMGHPAGLVATSTFIRDNSSYRVRFVATDARGRRCEDAVNVVVGSPPSGLPAKVAEQPAPRLGAELGGVKGDVVVLPVEEWSYQGVGDGDWQPNQQAVFNPPMNNLNSVVYRKDRLPQVLGADAVDVRYSAASNPADPVGAGSINSTSRNWSPAAGADVEFVAEAAVQKTDLWDRVDRRSDTTPHAANYISRFFAWQATVIQKDKTRPLRDEGYLVDIVKPDKVANVPKQGAYMPGSAKAYEANDPKDFQQFDAANGQFVSGYIPVTDVDDTGRVNPYPLMRVQVQDKSGKAEAATDGALATSRDHHCRECHAKGKIAANPATQWTQEAFHSSTYGKKQHQAKCGGEQGGGHNHGGGGFICDFAPPRFFDATGLSFREQEDAALKNIYSLHDFYDGMDMLNHRETGAWSVNADGARTSDGSFYCAGCHVSPTRFGTMGITMWDDYFSMDETNDYWPNYTLTMHKFHGRLQRDPANREQILREPGGFPKLWDPAQGANPNTLFPVQTARGDSRPMEENCLQCHAGQREPQYRDRMATAGVTCYDCHGDMLATGLAYEKSRLSPDGNKHRVSYYDEPDCGSCHTGNANESGKGFFSAGVLKRAFAASDPSATPLEPKRERFAVPPTSQTMPVMDWNPDTETETARPVSTTSRLYRNGKDSHGNVACAACHGVAHGVWPNADPSANDNVTALELQGHTGTILECNVCHTADAFANQKDLDGGQYSGDTKAGILGGPHDMHPVADPNWWKQAQGDVANSDGTNYGGWHNNYAKTAGANNEDQCAACHGNDHKGTRLSRTPVERVFDFSALDFNKLKKAGFKAKVVKVAAGTQIGCDTCHSVELSFKGSPGH